MTITVRVDDDLVTAGVGERSWTVHRPELVLVKQPFWCTPGPEGPEKPGWDGPFTYQFSAYVQTNPNGHSEGAWKFVKFEIESPDPLTQPVPLIDFCREHLIPFLEQNPR